MYRDFCFVGGYMEYITIREAAEKWNIQERRVSLLCRDI